jgi:hypothetical protein
VSYCAVAVSVLSTLIHGDTEGIQGIAEMLMAGIDLQFAVEDECDTLASVDTTI